MDSSNAKAFVGGSIKTHLNLDNRIAEDEKLRNLSKKTC